MPLYEVYVLCDQCGRPHSVHIKLSVPEEVSDGACIAEVFAGRSLPPEIVYLQSNKYRCPHTKQLFPATDIEKVLLFAGGQDHPDG